MLVFCPVLPFTQIPWPLTPTTWKQLSTLTSQVSGSVSPYRAARLVRLLKLISSYPIFLLIPSSGAAASMFESATTTDRFSGHPSLPYCVVCAAPLFGLIHISLSLLFLVNVLSINYHCPLICIWVPFLADPRQNESANSGPSNEHPYCSSQYHQRETGTPTGSGIAPPAGPGGGLICPVLLDHGKGLGVPGLNSKGGYNVASELIDTPVFHNLAQRPIKYRVSVHIPTHKWTLDKWHFSENKLKWRSLNCKLAGVFTKQACLSTVEREHVHMVARLTKICITLSRYFRIVHMASSVSGITSLHIRQPSSIPLRLD